ncbi:hypothetical protein [Pyrobaculum aerophilum]|uniref:Uncharacterized protein n=1 Tax=Pyrobaculum aerophilum TaxID=13773 RepID=A0A371R493_9CREN|nr:hypothetical protein [Pyrobaculum aerophilum]RFA96179.1 hypothetical protein CGL51_05815 [Pyrobaculum aerophilum]RFA98587.1 hypothetical protein CGL52_06605 [Pyrobaculum aerophilum]
MVLKRRTLSEAFGNHEEEVVMAPAVNTTAEQVAAPQVSAAQQNAGWQYHLAVAITQMPEEMAAKLLNCLPKEVIVEMLKSRSNDPLMKLALFLLQKNV